jgi:hypothetical protein
LDRDIANVLASDDRVPLDGVRVESMVLCGSDVVADSALSGCGATKTTRVGDKPPTLALISTP